MLKPLLFPILLLLLITGCSRNNEKNLSKSLTQRVVHDKNLQKTEKIVIRSENETKLTVTATYINAEKSLKDGKEKKNEQFIIGIYDANSTLEDELLSDEQNLTINLPYPEPKKGQYFTKDERKIRDKGIDTRPIYIKKISINDPVMKNMALVSNWNTYYFVVFPHSKSNKFRLTYRNKIYGTRKVKDCKVKYIYVTRTVNGRLKKRRQRVNVCNGYKTEIIDYGMDFAKIPKYSN